MCRIQNNKLNNTVYVAVFSWQYPPATANYYAPPPFWQLHQQPHLPIIRYRILASHSKQPVARATFHRKATIQIRGSCHTPQRNSLYRKQQIGMPKGRLTTLIEREFVLSNWYDLSRGFTAALAVTP